MMSNYIPRYTKKRERLSRLVRKLHSAISENAAKERIVKLAEEVRQGEIRVLRAERARVTRSEEGAGARAEFDAKIRNLEAISIEQFLGRHGWRLES